MEYILSAGTNKGDRRANIERCAQAVSLLPGTTLVDKTSIYETEPVGYDNQQNFYNILLKVESELEPNELLGACLGIEAAFGRVRKIRFGPRIMDVDIIFAEDKNIKSKNLIVPHPRFYERRFILEPLLEFFPDGIVYGKDIKPFIEKIKGQEVFKA